MTTELHFDAVEDMVNWLFANPEYRKEKRFTLENRSSREYFDAEAGAKWEEKLSALPWVSYSDKEAHAEYEKQRTALYKVQPKTEMIWTWYLDGDNRTVITLSQELADSIHAVWTRGPAYRGADKGDKKLVGRLTVGGIMKRLGNKGFDKQIDQAVASVKAKNDMRSRNHQRNEVVANLTQALERIEKSPTAFDNGLVLSVKMLLANVQSTLEQE